MIWICYIYKQVSHIHLTVWIFLNQISTEEWKSTGSMDKSNIKEALDTRKIWLHMQWTFQTWMLQWEAWKKGSWTLTWCSSKYLTSFPSYMQSSGKSTRKSPRKCTTEQPTKNIEPISSKVKKAIHTLQIQWSQLMHQRKYQLCRMKWGFLNRNWNENHQCGTSLESTEGKKLSRWWKQMDRRKMDGRKKVHGRKKNMDGKKKDGWKKEDAGMEGRKKMDRKRKEDGGMEWRKKIRWKKEDRGKEDGKKEERRWRKRRKKWIERQQIGEERRIKMERKKKRKDRRKAVIWYVYIEKYISL